MECRKETEYALRKTPVTKTIREKEYQFFITAAYCKECGCEVGVKGILEYNAGEIDEQFRKAEDIVTTEEIEKLGKIYSLGKAPLSIALGFGEVTITRYLAGQIPSKEYSDIMRAALSDTKVMKEMLESNKDKPTSVRDASSRLAKANKDINKSRDDINKKSSNEEKKEEENKAKETTNANLNKDSKTANTNKNEENKDKLADAAYKKAISAIAELDALFSVPSKMLMVISYIFEQLGEVTPLALQKMLYFIQGLYFSRYGTPLFSDNCQAWVHGPVYAEIYDMFSSFRYDPIDDPRFELLKGKSTSLDEKEREVIDLVVNTFGMYGGKVLERITHKETPWLEAREGYSENEPSEEEISKDAIKEYFVSVREEYDLNTEAGIKAYIDSMLASA